MEIVVKEPREGEFGPTGPIRYEVHEGDTFENGAPRPSLEVDLWHPREALGELRPAEVSWPSTSDKRPELARALAQALVQAADRAEELNREAGLS